MIHTGTCYKTQTRRIPVTVTCTLSKDELELIVRALRNLEVITLQTKTSEFCRELYDKLDTLLTPKTIEEYYE